MFLDFLKTQHSYYRHLTTLNTGAILIVIAFIEKVFKQPIPISIYMIPVAVLGFIGSLLWSLHMMRTIHGYQQKFVSSCIEIMAFQSEDMEAAQKELERIQGELKTGTDKLGKTANRMQALSNWSFEFGMIILSIFASLNLIFN